MLEYNFAYSNLSNPLRYHSRSGNFLTNVGMKIS